MARDGKLYQVQLAWAFLIVGAVAYIIGYSCFDKSTLIFDILIKAGDVFVIGAFVGFISNASLFIGIIKRQLEDIIYSKQYLSKRTDLQDIWENISKQLFKSKFPKISNELLSLIKTNYFPVENDQVSYYEDYKIYIDIEWEDEAKKLLKTTTASIFDLHAESTSAFPVTLKNWTDVNSKDDECFFLIKECVVNSKIVSPQIKESYDDKKKEVVNEYTINLEGQTKYEIKIESEKVYSFEKDFTISFRAKYIVHKLLVEINYPANMDAKFICRGTTDDFRDTRNSKRSMSKEYRGLILPRQGYVIALKEEQLTNQLNKKANEEII